MDADELITMDIDKWGRIVNYMYIPSSAADEEAHEKMLKSYNLHDATAYMSPFYPTIKMKIQKSWERLFDDSYVLSTMRIGTLWEIKQEWIKNIIR